MTRLLALITFVPLLYAGTVFLHVPETVSPETNEDVYVGDDACTNCHAEIASTYAKTNHKLGFSRFDPATEIAQLNEETTVYHEPKNLYYEVFSRGDTLFQREYRLGLNGEIIHERIEPADYVIGSGNATRSYLMEHNGFVTEMPITWFVDRHYWDMSPGYEEANDRFERKIIVDCLTCHTAIPQFTPYTQNHYTNIPLGISCERCHGPARAHVDYWENQPAETTLNTPDTTIVNPAYLDRGRQMSNCQQCHLAGIFVYKEGENATTFRPGQELVENRTVYVPEEHLTDPEWVGIDSHPLRLARSACYQESEMTCSTCHDPHRPSSLLQEDHYNTVCQSCHASNDASAHSCARQEEPTSEISSASDCTGCHMQKGGTSDIPHVSFSDHWIRKNPGPPRNPDDAKTAFETFEPITLVALQQEGRSGHILEKRDTQSAMDRLENAIAYFAFYEQMHRLPEYLPLIIEETRAGLAAGQDHVEARIALARSLASEGQVDEALNVLAEASEIHPANAWIAFWQGTILLENNDLGASIVALQRAVELEPYFIEAQTKLGETYTRLGRLNEARSTLEEIVRLNPIHQPRAWFNLGMIYLRQQRLADAEQAFREASNRDPDLVPAHIQLGNLLLQNNQLDEAETVLMKAIASDSRSVEAYGTMALVYLQKGDEAGARQLLFGLLQIDPTNQTARSLLRQIEQ